MNKQIQIGPAATAREVGEGKGGKAMSEWDKAGRERAKFNVGQVVVLKLSADKVPTRILSKDFRDGTTWYYQILYHPGYYNQCTLRPLTQREKGGK